MKQKTKLAIWSYFNAEEVQLLRTPTQAVDVSTLDQSDVQRWIDDMLTTMRQANGIGLAAPQVGRSLRLAVISKEADRSLSEPLVLVNPKITEFSPEQELGEEGCLSIVGVYGNIQRSLRIVVRAFNRRGSLVTITAQGLLARVIQHEVDHLDGVLFLDRTTDITQGKELIT